MGFARVKNSQRIARTVDGGYVYREIVYRQTPDGLWQVEFPEGFRLLVGSQEKAHRTIDKRCEDEGVR